MTEPNLVAVAIEQIDKWLKATGMAESRLGMLACANTRAIKRVREKTASLETLEAILEYIKNHPAKATGK